MQKQPFRGVIKKRCSENMQQIYRRTPMPKCDFNKVALQYGNEKFNDKKNYAILLLCNIKLLKDSPRFANNFYKFTPFLVPRYLYKKSSLPFLF